MVTPFTSSGEVDYDQAQKLALALIDSGSDGVVVTGSTGEAPSLTRKEKARLWREIKQAIGDKGSVIAGAGTYSTSESLELSELAIESAVDGLLIVVPYYNKPSQEGLYQHYKAINDECGIPIIIYNIPSRSVIDMSVDTMARLFELKNIVGVKDATGNLDRVDQQRKKMGADFIQLTGEDGNALEFNRRGGVGCISVTANIAPKLCSDFQRFSVSKSDNEIKEAERIDQVLQPVHKSLFIESNPSPVKYAAKLLKLCNDDVRLPLVKVMKTTQDEIKKALSSAKLI